MLTVGPKNTVYSDEISFVFWDEIYGWYKIAKKIGKFIAQRRRDKNMIPAELVGKLNITDRAISKKEIGKGILDSSIMFDLCN